VRRLRLTPAGIASIISSAILAAGGVSGAFIALQGEGSPQSDVSCALVDQRISHLLETDAAVRRFYATHPQDWKNLESPSERRACGSLDSLIASLTKR
jgi:hypothetical protein